MNLFDSCRKYLQYFPHLKQNSQFLELLKERDHWAQRPTSKVYLDVLEKLPALSAPLKVNFNKALIIGEKKDLTPNQWTELKSLLLQLNPWRKGPLSLFDIHVDSEWRSDWKWERLAPFLPRLKNKMVLDIGCNNGYYMFRSLEHRPKHVLGIDPVFHNLVQFLAVQEFVQSENLSFDLLGIEHLNFFENSFDVIFSMGIIYHHRNPIQQLQDIYRTLKPGGSLFIETIVIPGSESMALFPEGSYGKMKNVWFIPTVSCLKNWLSKTHFKEVELSYFAPTTLQEQRNTEFCPPPRQSLKDFLNPNDLTKTIEGHPAPYRACFVAKKL